MSHLNKVDKVYLRLLSVSLLLSLYGVGAASAVSLSSAWNDVMLMAGREERNLVSPVASVRRHSLPTPPPRRRSIIDSLSSRLAEVCKRCVPSKIAMTSDVVSSEYASSTSRPCSQWSKLTQWAAASGTCALDGVTQASPCHVSSPYADRLLRLGLLSSIAVRAGPACA